MTVSEGEQGRALVEAGKKLTGGWGQSMGSEELQGLALPTSVMLDCESREIIYFIISPTQHPEQCLV